MARANVISLTAEEPLPGAFNVASGRPRTVLEMAQALTAAAGAQTLEPIVSGESRLGDVRHVFASAERARRVRVDTGTEVFDGTTRGLESDGALRVQTESGEIKVVRAGDVQLFACSSSMYLWGVSAADLLPFMSGSRGLIAFLAEDMEDAAEVLSF